MRLKHYTNLRQWELTPRGILNGDVPCMGQTLWPGERLSAAEVTRRLALTQLLWAESKRNMVERVRIFPQAAK